MELLHIAHALYRTVQGRGVARSNQEDSVDNSSLFWQLCRIWSMDIRFKEGNFSFVWRREALPFLRQEEVDEKGLQREMERISRLDRQFPPAVGKPGLTAGELKELHLIAQSIGGDERLRLQCAKQIEAHKKAMKQAALALSTQEEVVSEQVEAAPEILPPSPQEEATILTLPVERERLLPRLRLYKKRLRLQKRA